jgi:S1-C subfamily serine protease
VLSWVVQTYQLEGVTMPRRTVLPIVVILAAVLLGAAVGAGTYAGLGGNRTTTVVREVATSGRPTASTTSSSVGSVYRKVAAGVVEITTTTSSGSSQFPFGGQQSQAQGSGFVYDTSGHIVTSEHVVAGANSIAIRFPNGSKYKATVVGTDTSTDLAVLDVDAPSSVLKPLSLGDSTVLQVGDEVVAIGSPFGLEATVTSGIVSALHRNITAPNQATITDAIQTDAPINSGNSGGPLLNLAGEVIGVNAQIESASGGNNGVGFAVPSETIRTVVPQLLAKGKVQHAFLGVQVETIPAGAAGSLGSAAGVAIVSVQAGTPALKAGLKASTGTKTAGAATYPVGGDVITAVDGIKVTRADELRTLIDGRRPGDKVKLTVVRNGKTRAVTVTLAERPS